MSACLISENTQWISMKFGIGDGRGLHSILLGKFNIGIDQI